MKVKVGWYHGGCGIRYLASEQKLIYVVAVPDPFDYGPPYRYHCIDKTRTQKSFYDIYNYDDDTDEYDVTSKEQDAIDNCYYPVPEREIKGTPKLTFEIDVAEDSYLYDI